MNRLIPEYPRLFEWWADDDLVHGRPSVDHPEVQRLISSISPGDEVTNLGGTMSLNLRLNSKELVLRIHQPFVSKQRILAVQEVRRQLSKCGVIVPVAVEWANSTVHRCGNRWAEIEKFIPHERIKPSEDTYIWLFSAMGKLHRVLETIDLPIPRPMVATYASPTTLQRRMIVTELAVQGDEDTMKIVQLLQELIKRLRKLWIPASRLPTQLVHGDIRLNNICQNTVGKTVYLDFGFLACRPRIHELSYSIAYMLLALGENQSSDGFTLQSVSQLIEAYEDATNSRITQEEKRALIPYAAAVPLYHAVHDGFKDTPEKSIQQLHSRQSFLSLSERLLTHPEILN